MRERALWYCKIFSCVQRSSPIAGCTGKGREREKKKEDLLAESPEKNFMLYLNKS
jgi:hypothetical protein